MGMLGLFRAWLDRRNEKSRARRRDGLLRAETLEYRRMLTSGVTGTTLEVDGTAAADTISVKQDATGVTVMVNNVTNNYGPGITIHTINIFAMDGNDQVTVNSVFSNTTVNVNGGNDTNTLIDTNQANTWKITGPNSGGINNNINFSNIQNLQSGDFNDSFQFSPNGFVAGTIDGGQGINLLDYSGRNVGVSVNLATSSATAIGGGFTNITDLKGSVDNTDILTGLNSASTWNITGVNAGNVNSQFFYTGVENLVGGSSDDQFAFSPAGVERSIIGGLGNNLLDYSARTAAVTTNLSLNASTAIGASYQQIGRIIGSSSGSDILTGYNQVNTWSIDGADIGSVTNPYSSIRYQGYENVVGGNTSDTFQMSDSGVISGALSGGGGLNKLNYSSRSAAILLNLATNSVTSVGGGYTAIQSFTGSKAVGDQIIGANSDTAWDISGSNSGDVNGTLFFASFENLYGGTQNDSFNFQGAGFLSGSIDGALGLNSLDYSGRHNIPQSGIVVNLGSSTATAIGSGYLHISHFVGTPHLAPLPGQITRAPDTLIAPNTANTWQINGADTGTVAQASFSGFENLTGGTGVDDFNMLNSGSVSGIVNGGAVAPGNLAGGNWLDYSGTTTPVTVNLATFTAEDIGKITNIQNVHGGDGANTLTGDSTGNALIGGQAADVLTAGSGNSLLIGGLGDDALKAGTGHNILIGGYTVYDGNLGQLSSILAEWKLIWGSTNSPPVSVFGPTGTSNTVIAVNSKPYTFAVQDFGFSDDNDASANVFTDVKITTLPTAGTLTYKGANVTAGEFIPVLDISKGALVYSAGPGVATGSFTFQVKDSGSTANGGVNLDPNAKTMTVLSKGPVGTSNTVSALNSQPYTFGIQDFGFTDPTNSPAKTFTGVRLTTLPSTGSLKDNGVNVTLGQIISVADIGSGKLVYSPTPGNATSSFKFQVKDNGSTLNGGVNLDPNPKTMTILINVNLLLNPLRNGGGLNGSNVLVADQTVHTDAAVNSITSGNGPNWLWGGPDEFKQTAAQKSRDITDTPIHNSLILSGSSTVTFNVQSFVVTIDPVITITTASNTKLASATVKLGANSDPTHDVLGFVASGATGNITGSFNQAKGLLTLTSAGSTATLAQWQAALRKVVFSNNDATPSTGARTVYFQISDGTYFSNNLSSTVNVNYVPVLAGSSNLKYTTLQAATPINTNITVSDPNSQTLQSATVSISTYYQSNQDQLTFTGNASTGDIFATFDFTTGIMTLKSGGLPATLAQYQAALRLVSYVNSSSFPLTTTRTVSYQVNDGSASSNIVKSTITIS